jgi:hypothetical protein
MDEEDLPTDDERPHYYVRMYRTENERTLVWVPDLDITLEGDWRWVDDAESAAVAAIAARLEVPPATFAVDVDCPIDMDPDISPEFKAELERRAAASSARRSGGVGRPSPGAHQPPSHPGHRRTAPI